MNILFGPYTPDEGSISIAGRVEHIRNTADALRLGIGMVHQHFQLVPRHTVMENLLVGRRGRRGLLDVRSVGARLDEIGRRFGIALDPSLQVSELTIGEQQRLEILKALLNEAQVLILDEPTAALTPSELDGLFEAVRSMSSQGMGIILISHKLREVLGNTSRIMVMRLGKLVDDRINDGSTSERRLAELMCGREIKPLKKTPPAPERVLLRLSGVSTAGSESRRLKDVSIELRGGEIVGVAGVAGNGQRELADVISGVLPLNAGQIEIDGRELRVADPRAAQGLRLARVPEDRIGTGLLMNSPLAYSLVLPEDPRATVQPPAGSRIPPSSGSRRSGLPHLEFAPRAQWLGPAICLAATSKRPCWRASSHGTLWSCWPLSRHADWMSGRLSSCIASFWNCAPPDGEFC